MQKCDFPKLSRGLSALGEPDCHVLQFAEKSHHYAQFYFEIQRRSPRKGGLGVIIPRIKKKKKVLFCKHEGLIAIENPHIHSPAIASVSYFIINTNLGFKHKVDLAFTGERSPKKAPRRHSCQTTAVTRKLLAGCKEKIQGAVLLLLLFHRTVPPLELVWLQHPPPTVVAAGGLRKWPAEQKASLQPACVTQKAAAIWVQCHLPSFNWKSRLHGFTVTVKHTSSPDAFVVY